tara:strand:+ start:36 stop:953 length:918 start_codon:yes stop_codon:yes gene_type:complete
MQLKHIEHPEDSILTGDLTVLDWFTEVNSKISLKIDGTPSIVWGTNPETGNFFVGTKSVFNKIRKKINESYEDIERNHPNPDLQNKLKACFDNLPRTDNIYQGDLIGFGGDDYYQPNTVGYLFPHKIHHNIIVAPHTVYEIGNTLNDSVATPLECKLESTYDGVLFVQCNAKGDFADEIEENCKFAKQMAKIPYYVNKSKAGTLKQTINQCIRMGNMPIIMDDELEVIADVHCVDINLLRLWQLVKSIKEDALALCSNDAWFTAYLDEEIDGEGYVMSNKYGTYKLVDREQFSRSNFLNQRSWVS